MNVTVALPPHANGAPWLLLVNCGLHPPLTVTAFIHAAYSAFTASCVWQLATVLSLAGVKLAVGAVGTVNVADVVKGVVRQ